MSTSPEALVKPELLIWARETSGLQAEDVVKRTGFGWAQLEEWEQGISRPSISQVRRLCEVYRRPLAVFFLPEPPKGFSVPHDYRTIGDKRHADYSPALRFEIRRIEFQREAVLEIADDDDLPPATFVGSVQRKTNAEKLGQHIRGMVGVTLKQQVGTAAAHDSLALWKSAVESLGIIVSQFGDVEIAEARGFSLTHDRAPVIALNIKDVPVARTFTLFHELTHLLLNEPGVCDLHELPKPNAHQDRTERFCNEIAAAVLLPEAAFRRALGIGDTTTPRNWPIEDVKRVARRFKVSGEVVARRLVSLGAAEFDFFMTTRQQLRQERDLRLEPLRDKKNVKKSPASTAFYRAGNLVTRTVLDAYERAEITSSEASDIFGVRVRHLDKLRQLQASSETRGAAG